MASETKSEPNAIQSIRILRCTLCCMDFHEKVSLEEHSRHHAEGRMLPCPNCGMSFLFKQDLEAHLHNSDGDKTVHKCPDADCHAVFENRSCYLFHMTFKHDGLHRCPICERRFIHYAVLQKHIQKAHSKPNEPSSVTEMEKSKSEIKINRSSSTNIPVEVVISDSSDDKHATSKYKMSSGSARAISRKTREDRSEEQEQTTTTDTDDMFVPVRFKRKKKVVKIQKKKVSEVRVVSPSEDDDSVIENDESSKKKDRKKCKGKSLAAKYDDDGSSSSSVASTVSFSASQTSAKSTTRRRRRRNSSKKSSNINSDDQLWRCAHCPKEVGRQRYYTTMRSLNRHIHFQHPGAHLLTLSEKPRTIKCPCCEDMFTANQYLSLHLRRVHKNYWFEHWKEFESQSSSAELNADDTEEDDDVIWLEKDSRTAKEKQEANPNPNDSENRSNRPSASTSSSSAKSHTMYLCQACGMTLGSERSFKHHKCEGITLTDSDSETGAETLIKSVSKEISKTDPDSRESSDDTETKEILPTSNDKSPQLQLKLHRSETLVCKICSERFTTKRGLIMHTTWHKRRALDSASSMPADSTAAAGNHEADSLSSGFNTGNTDNQRSMETSTENMKKFVSTSPKKKFKRRGSLTTMRKSKTASLPQVYQCPFCPQTFTTIRGQKIHAMKHKKNESFAYDVQMPRSRGINGMYKYSCPAPECDKVFPSTTNLKNHSRKCPYLLQKNEPNDTSSNQSNLGLESSYSTDHDGSINDDQARGKREVSDDESEDSEFDTGSESSSGTDDSEEDSSSSSESDSDSTVDQPITPFNVWNPPLDYNSVIAPLMMPKPSSLPWSQRVFEVDVSIPEADVPVLQVNFPEAAKLVLEDMITKGREAAIRRYQMENDVYECGVIEVEIPMEEENEKIKGDKQDDEGFTECFTQEVVGVEEVCEEAIGSGVDDKVSALKNQLGREEKEMTAEDELNNNNNYSPDTSTAKIPLDKDALPQNNDLFIIAAEGGITIVEDGSKMSDNLRPLRIEPTEEVNIEEKWDHNRFQKQRKSDHSFNSYGQGDSDCENYNESAYYEDSSDDSDDENMPNIESCDMDYLWRHRHDGTQKALLDYSSENVDASYDFGKKRDPRKIKTFCRFCSKEYYAVGKEDHLKSKHPKLYELMLENENESHRMKENKESLQKFTELERRQQKERENYNQLTKQGTKVTQPPPPVKRLKVMLPVRSTGDGKREKNVDGKYDCHLCERSYVLVDSLRRHLRKVHSSSASYAPKVVAAHPGPDGKFVCQFCPKSYTLDYNLKRHIKAAHPHKHRLVLTRKPFQCPYCPRIFFSSGKRDTHAQTSHKNEMKKNSRRKSDRSKNVSLENSIPEIDASRKALHSPQKHPKVNSIAFKSAARKHILESRKKLGSSSVSISTGVISTSQSLKVAAVIPQQKALLPKSSNKSDPYLQLAQNSQRTPTSAPMSIKDMKNVTVKLSKIDNCSSSKRPIKQKLTIIKQKLHSHPKTGEFSESQENVDTVATKKKQEIRHNLDDDFVYGEDYDDDEDYVPSSERNKNKRRRVTFNRRRPDPNSNDNYKCRKCGGVFLLSCTLQRHYDICARRNMEPIDETNFCEICDRIFMDSDLLNKHQLRHHSDATKDFECDICSKRFTTQQSAIRHKRMVHY